jgi:RNA polymerase sigma factor (sigma-70 family)
MEFNRSDRARQPRDTLPLRPDPHPPGQAGHRTDARAKDAAKTWAPLLTSINERRSSWLRRIAQRLPGWLSRKVRPEDVFQDACVIVIEKQLFRGLDIKQASARFAGVVRNTIRNLARLHDRKRRNPGPGCLVLSFSEGSRTESGLRKLISKRPRVEDAEVCREELGRVLALIPSLREDLASIVTEVGLRGRSVGEVAAELGIPAAAASRRLYRARDKLLEDLARKQPAPPGGNGIRFRIRQHSF